MLQEFKQFNNMFIKNINMRFTSYTKADSYYEFNGENGEKYVIPADKVILVEDSDSITVKTTGGRNTVGYLVK